MLGGGRQFVELVDDEAEQPVARCSALRVAQSYFNKIMRRRPVFLVMFELVCPKLFYGWVVVFACGIGWWCVAPAATFGVGVYVNYWLSDPAMEVLISRSLLSTYWTLALVLTGVMSPLLGKLYAALGARMMVAVAGPLFALTVASMGRITNGHFLIVLFWALRILMSVYDLVFKVSVPMWFVKRRGTAIAISSLMSSSMLAYPSVIEACLPLFDWKILAVIQAFACLAISAFVNLALLQNPETYGLHPDGDTPACAPLETTQDDLRTEQEGMELHTKSGSVTGGESAGSVDAEQPSGVRRRSGEQADAVSTSAQELPGPGSDANALQELEGLTVRQALRRPIFWLIVLSIFFIDVLWGGFNLHFVSVLEDQGLGRTSGASTFMSTSIAAAISSLLCGPFFDRLPLGMKHRGIAVATGCGVLTLASIYLVASPRHAWLIGVFYGILDSFSFIGVGVAMSDSFGRAHLAQLMSITSGCASISLGLGPLIFGASKDLFSSYTPVLVLTGSGLLITTLVQSFTRSVVS